MPFVRTTPIEAAIEKLKIVPWPLSYIKKSSRCACLRMMEGFWSSLERRSRPSNIVVTTAVCGLFEQSRTFLFTGFGMAEWRWRVCVGSEHDSLRWTETPSTNKIPVHVDAYVQSVQRAHHQFKARERQRTNSP